METAFKNLFILKMIKHGGKTEYIDTIYHHLCTIVNIILSFHYFAEPFQNKLQIYHPTPKYFNKHLYKNKDVLLFSYKTITISNKINNNSLVAFYYLDHIINFPIKSKIYFINLNLIKGHVLQLVVSKSFLLEN